MIGTADATHKDPQNFNEEGILEYQPIIADGYLDTNAGSADGQMADAT